MKELLCRIFGHQWVMIGHRHDCHRSIEYKCKRCGMTTVIKN